MNELTFLALTGGVGASAAGLTWDKLAVDRNRRKTPGDHRAMVLMNVPRLKIGSIYWPGFVESVCAHTLTDKGITADWVHDATLQDLVDAVNDPKYKSIVVVGEDGGLGRYNWVTREGVVTAERLRGKWKGTPKEGYWFQYTKTTKVKGIPSDCEEKVRLGYEEGRHLGYEDGNIPLGHYVMEDKGKILGFKGRVGKLGLYLIEPTVIGKLPKKE